MEKSIMIEKIIKLEWDAFDQTDNIGGRADCQDEWKTFYIMRRSQYLTWTDELLESYMSDLEEANLQGRNLIAEKYGRMMESTNPEEYEKIKGVILSHSVERKKITEEIVAIQVTWMEEFAKENPSLAQNMRVIHTAEDTPDTTSYETYLRGEMGTYSDKTLRLYGYFIVTLYKEGKNLAALTIANTFQPK